MSETNARAPMTIDDTDAATAMLLDDEPPPSLCADGKDKDEPPPSSCADGKDKDEPPPSSCADGKDEDDLFSLPAAEALRLLSASVELLVRMTGDIPPTPPPTTPTNPQMSGLQVEKENIVRSHSQQNLSRLRRQPEATAVKPAASPKASKGAGEGAGEGADTVADASSSSNTALNKMQAYSASMTAHLLARKQSATTTTHPPSTDCPSPSSSPTPPTAVDGVHLKQHPPDPRPYIIIGSDSQPVNVQHGAITRKFYSKKEPPISISQYLTRLHQFCPMSTAVYLATSLYIHRLAVEERAIPVTRRNAHRLVLAGLRVAMKALEDLSYPHAKIAKVGGVSEVELARLEISFCFLAGFELVVGRDRLTSHWEELRGGKAHAMLRGLDVPTLTLGRRPREVSPAGG